MGYDDVADRYDRLARQISYWAFEELDDRPEWERENEVWTEHCRICRRDLEVDDFGECESCRAAGGWCRWCGLDRIVYRSRLCCRTCYRWLIRNEDRWNDEELMARLRVVVERRRRRRHP